MSSGRGLAPFIVERRQTPGGHAARCAGPRRCNAHWVGFTVDGLVYKALQLTFAQVPWTSGPARGHSPAARLLHFGAARGLFVQKPNRDADGQGCGPSDLERPCGLFSAGHGVWPPSGRRARLRDTHTCRRSDLTDLSTASRSAATLEVMPGHRDGCSHLGVSL